MIDTLDPTILYLWIPTAGWTAHPRSMCPMAHRSERSKRAYHYPQVLHWFLKATDKPDSAQSSVNFEDPDLYQVILRFAAFVSLSLSVGDWCLCWTFYIRRRSRTCEKDEWTRRDRSDLPCVGECEKKNNTPASARAAAVEAADDKMSLRLHNAISRTSSHTKTEEENEWHESSGRAMIQLQQWCDEKKKFTVDRRREVNIGCLRR